MNVSRKRNCSFNATGIHFGSALRGLFEFEYSADALLLHPHLPTSVQSFRQPKSARFGNKTIYLICRQHSHDNTVTAVQINGRNHEHFQGQTATLDYSSLPQEAELTLTLG
ncbi:MAG: hypothetical protein WCT05_06775 [Lentisphaeria bacterium]